MPVEKKGFLTPKEAQPLFVTNPSIDSIRQWMVKGVTDRRPGHKGERIRLQYVREGDMFVTTKEWVADFQKACQQNTRKGAK